MKSHLNTRGEKVVQNGHGVGHVHNLLVFGDFGDEIARREIVTDGHTNTEKEHVGIDTDKLMTIKK